MGIISLSIPRLSYIAFELVEIDLKAMQSDPAYQAKQLKFINLAVIPKQLTYRLMARDSVTQVQSDVFIQRYDLQPEKVRFSGTFGDDYAIVNNQSLDGWQRLKQFEQEIVRKAKNHPDVNKVYAINYYDFLFQRWGSINIDSWTLFADAETNANLITYTLEFTITGSVIAMNLNDAITTEFFIGIVQQVANNQISVIDIQDVLSSTFFADLGLELVENLAVDFINSAPHQFNIQSIENIY